MPLCMFYTNVPNNKISENFEKRLSEILADVLAKPIERITVNLAPDQRMVRGGTSEPTCWLNIWSIGVFSADKNPVYASKLYPFISEELGISNDRHWTLESLEGFECKIYISESLEDSRKM